MASEFNPLLMTSLAPIPNPSIVEAGSTQPVTNKPSLCSRFGYLTRGLVSVISDFLVLLWIGLVYVIPAGIGIIVVLGLMFGLSLGLAAANGAIFMLTGNGILRASHLSHYTSNASAASIGAVGGIIASIALGILVKCLQYNRQNAAWYIAVPISVAHSTLCGAIGSAVLLHNHVDLGGIDVLYAARAGALGGAILCLGVAFLLPSIFGAVMILLSPLWGAILIGLKWVSVHSSRSWNGRQRLYGYLSCTCGDAPEIEDELAQVLQHSKSQIQVPGTGNNKRLKVQYPQWIIPTHQLEPRYHDNNSGTIGR